MTKVTNSTDETRTFGGEIARSAKAGDVFALEGDLGCGKTEFVRGFVHFFDPSIIVRSPSFSIVNIYPTSSTTIHHFDFYRLGDASELFEIGFQEYIAGDGICLIEWATMFPAVLPQKMHLFRFFDEGLMQRKIIFDMPSI